MRFGSIHLPGASSFMPLGSSACAPLCSTNPGEVPGIGATPEGRTRMRVGYGVWRVFFVSCIFSFVTMIVLRRKRGNLHGSTGVCVGGRRPVWRSMGGGYHWFSYILLSSPLVRLVSWASWVVSVSVLLKKSFSPLVCDRLVLPLALAFIVSFHTQSLAAVIRHATIVDF